MRAAMQLAQSLSIPLRRSKSTVLKTASTAEFVTFSATATTPPQNQRKIEQFWATQHQRKIPLKHRVPKGFL